MSSALEMQASIDSTVEALQNLLRILDQSHQELQATTHTLESQIQVLDQATDQAKTEWNELTILFDQKPHEVETEINHVESGFNGLTQALSTWVEDDLNESEDHLTEAASTFESKIDTESNDLNQDFEALREEFNQLQTAFDSFENEISQEHQETAQVLQSLDQALEAIRTETESHKQETDAAFDQAEQEIGQVKLAEIEHHFGELSNQIEGEFTTLVTDQFSEFEDQFLNLFETFTQSVEEIGDNLHQQGAEVLSSVATSLESDAQAKIEDAVEESVESMLEELGEEIGENLMMMQIGQQVTTALAPILPEIIIAKHVLELASGIKDVFDF